MRVAEFDRMDAIENAGPATALPHGLAIGKQVLRPWSTTSAPG